MGAGVTTKLEYFGAILESDFKVNAQNGNIWEGMLNFQTFLGYA